MPRIAAVIAVVTLAACSGSDAVDPGNLDAADTIEMEVDGATADAADTGPDADTSGDPETAAELQYGEECEQDAQCYEGFCGDEGVRRGHCIVCQDDSGCSAPGRTCSKCGTCVAKFCLDGKQNFDERGTDCGFSCPGFSCKCRDTNTCRGTQACQDGVCGGDRCGAFD